jgi:hypothetical protein
MAYNLTDAQKAFLKHFVHEIREGKIGKGLRIAWALPYDGVGGIRPAQIDGYQGNIPEISELDFEDLCNEGYLHGTTRKCLFTSKAFDAVNSDFGASDQSSKKFLKLDLEGIEHLDQEIQDRCMHPLQVDGTDPKKWDSAIREAVIVLEKRLKAIYEENCQVNTGDKPKTGTPLVTALFREEGILTDKFASDSERDGYMKLYLGVFDVLRNPSAHGHIDPSPEEGGVWLGFIIYYSRN